MSCFVTLGFHGFFDKKYMTPIMRVLYIRRTAHVKGPGYEAITHMLNVRTHNKNPYQDYRAP